MRDDFERLIKDKRQASFQKIKRAVWSSVDIDVEAEQPWYSRWYSSIFNAFSHPSGVQHEEDHLSTLKGMKDPWLDQTLNAAGSHVHDIKHYCVRFFIKEATDLAVNHAAGKIDSTWRGKIIGFIAGKIGKTIAGAVYDLADKKEEIESIFEKVSAFQKKVDARFAHHRVKTSFKKLFGYDVVSEEIVNSLPEAILAQWAIVTNMFVARFVADEYVDPKEYDSLIRQLLDHIVLSLQTHLDFSRENAYQIAQVYFSNLAGVLGDLLKSKVPVSVSNHNTLKIIVIQLQSEDFLKNQSNNLSSDNEHLDLDNVIAYLQDLLEHPNAKAPSPAGFLKILNYLEYPLHPDKDGKTAEKKFKEIINLIEKIGTKKPESQDKEIAQFLVHKHDKLPEEIKAILNAEVEKEPAQLEQNVIFQTEKLNKLHFTGGLVRSIFWKEPKHFSVETLGKVGVKMMKDERGNETPELVDRTFFRDEFYRQQMAEILTCPKKDHASSLEQLLIETAEIFQRVGHYYKGYPAGKEYRYFVVMQLAEIVHQLDEHVDRSFAQKQCEIIENFLREHYGQEASLSHLKQLYSVYYLNKKEQRAEEVAYIFRQMTSKPAPKVVKNSIFPRLLSNRVRKNLYDNRGDLFSGSKTETGQNLTNQIKEFKGKNKLDFENFLTKFTDSETVKHFGDYSPLLKELDRLLTTPVEIEARSLDKFTFFKSTQCESLKSYIEKRLLSQTTKGAEVNLDGTLKEHSRVANVVSKIIELAQANVADIKGGAVEEWASLQEALKNKEHTGARGIAIVQELRNVLDQNVLDQK